MPFFFLISTPLFVSLFWLIYFNINGVQELQSRWSKPYQPALTTITIFYLATTALYACHCMYFAGYENAIGETIYGACNLCVYPLFFLYLTHLPHSGNEIKATTNTKTQSSLLSLLFLPAILVCIGYAICFSFSLEHIRQGVYLFARICFAVQVLYVWIVGSRLIRHYRDELDDYYSDDRSHHLRPLHILLQLFGAIAVASTLLNFIGREWFVRKYWIALPSILMSILLYALGYVAAELSRQNYTAGTSHTTDTLNIAESADTLPVVSDTSHPTENEEITEIVSNSTTSPTPQQTLSARIEELMASENPYLRANLTVQDLALMLGTNRTYLSEAFRHELGCSFSEYINRLRIEHAKQILSDPAFTTSKEAILTAQTESGFASESTFYHLFKQHTGMTPLQWRQQTAV